MSRVILREFGAVPKETRVQLVTNTEHNTTSIEIDGLVVAAFSGAYSEIAEDYYYQYLKEYTKKGWNLTL